jgi:hypothetical protein
LTEQGVLHSRQKIHSPVSAKTKTESEEQGMKIFYRDADGKTAEYTSSRRSLDRLRSLSGRTRTPEEKRGGTMKRIGRTIVREEGVSQQAISKLIKKIQNKIITLFE